MAKWDVHDIQTGQTLADGRIDFVLLGEVDDSGAVRTIPYTFDAKEVGPDALWPMVNEIDRWLQQHPDFPIQPYVWTPPPQDELEYRLKLELKHVKLRDYVEREISTDGAEPIPEAVKTAAAFARAAYNAFKDDPTSIPQDWADDKHWRAE